MIQRNLFKPYICLCIFLSFIVAPCVSFAQEPEADISAIFCEGISDEGLYDSHDFDSYKILVPGRDGWIYRSQSDFRQDFSLDDQALNNLEMLNDALAHNGTELVMLLTPTRGMMHGTNIEKSTLDMNDYNAEQAWKSYQAAARSIRKRGIHVVTIDETEQGSSFFYKRDHHWNPDGSRKAAQTVAQYIKEMQAYKDVPKIEYETKTADDYVFEGVSKKVFREICGTEQPPEIIQRQYTEQVRMTGAENDLFGQADVPEIVLAGTSNSTQIPSYANFEGFLKEELSADILNMSVSGGGLETAMLAYLKSDFFENNPARILVWELPGYYDISNHRKFFREAIPLGYGGCKQNAVAAAEDVLLQEDSQLIFRDLAGRDITGSDYYIHIKFDEPVTGPFKLDLRYRGNRDRFRFKPANRESARGPYLMVLRDDKKENLDKLVLWSHAQNMGSTADIRICRASNGKNIMSTELNGRESVSGLFNKFKNAIGF